MGAIRGLANLGRPADVAAPQLVAVLQQPTEDAERRATIESLGAIGGPQAIAALRGLVKRGGQDSATATEALGSIGPAAQSAVPEIARAARSGSPWAAKSLRLIAGSKAALPLAEALGDESLPPDLRSAMARELAELGPGAADALPSLAAALRQSFTRPVGRTNYDMWKYRDTLLWALSRLGAGRAANHRGASDR
jgi:HEAT repeat protein